MLPSAEINFQTEYTASHRSQSELWQPKIRLLTQLKENLEMIIRTAFRNSTAIFAHPDQNTLVKTR
jgi:hypothetical protein